ncbi:MAG TPA: glucose-1-phosphate adenylyltransferase subunit GlgD [Candidatus Pullichristensenella excrementipullorum]|nr:glucose-1-phosphate adenylyltransferase subunit GlgD [Candidatus Pullichristensenella excrementipullorum]
MKNVMGIIYTNKDDLSLRELTNQRSVAALPLAGRYRVVDFILSSMVNSGVRNVGVIMQRNYRSLMDHLGSGKEWDLHTRNNGLFLLPPFVTQETGGEYLGVLDALRANFDYLRRSKQRLALLTNSNMVFNMNFEPMIRQHEQTDADITLLYTKVRRDMELSSAGKHTHAFLNVEKDGRISDMEVNPNAANYDTMYMNVLLIKRTLLMHLVDGAAAHGEHDINRELIQPAIKSGSLKVYGYEFEGYYRRIETIKSYFRCNMDLLDYNVRQELFKKSPVYTKTRDDVPAVYREGNSVKNSLVADGCVIEGSVENCVLFRGVHIGRNASVKNAIIMQDSEIEDSVELENVILDKNVTVRAHGRLIGQVQYPIVIGKNVTL